MKNIILLGASVSGMNIYDIIQDINKVEKIWNVIAYLDENKEIKKQFDIPVYTSFDEIEQKLNIIPKKTYVISGIGSPKNRCRLMESAKSKGYLYAQIVHPTANISNSVKLGTGIIICQFCSIQSFVEIGDLSYLHAGDLIGPKVKIGYGVTINGHVAVSANTIISNKTYIGVGTKIIQNMNVGKESIIGAGTIIITDVPDNCLFVGIPGVVKKSDVDGN